MADKIKAELDIDVRTIPGDKGEFTVWVGEQVVAKKSWEGFPTEEQVVAAVAAARASQAPA